MLKSNPAKCKFASDESKYLGYFIDADGIRPCLTKLSAIEHVPAPTSARETKSILGLLGYYRRFVRNPSKIAAPVSDLTIDGKELLWTEQCDSQLTRFQTSILSNAVLHRPDFSLPYNSFKWTRVLMA